METIDKQKLLEIPDIFTKQYHKLKDLMVGRLNMILDILPKNNPNIPILKRFQSLSIDVPWRCPNACKYCVSSMHKEELWDTIKTETDFEQFRRRYIDAMSWVKDEWTDTLMLTWSSSDPITNKKFLKFIESVNEELGDKKFRKIEIQTSWIAIDDEKLDLLEEIWVKTISLSLSSLNSDENTEISWIKPSLAFDIEELAKKIKNRWFNLRLSFNLNKAYHKEFENWIENFFKKCENLWADQIIFRELYTSWEWEIDKWIQENKFDEKLLKEIKKYIKQKGKILWVLPFWQTLYSINWAISTLVDDDCMNKKSGIRSVQKYSIIRPNWKLYSHWDDKWSLIF